MTAYSKGRHDRRWLWLLFLISIGGLVFYFVWPHQPLLATGPDLSSSPDPAQHAHPATPAASAKEVPEKGSCRAGDPLAGVYHPSRLKVMKPCQTITGIVEKILKEEDGDYHIDVRLDPEYRGLLIPGNAQQGGDLVIEIICAKPSSKAYEQAACNIYQKPNLPIPHVRDQIEVSGPYVNDTKHNWAEIHPVWQLVVLSPAASR